MDFTDKKLLVIGDIILDEYIEGTVTRISPEAPIPILDKKKHYYRLGGATNVARNLKSLGANVWIIGRIGEDAGGEQVKHLLSEERINIDLLLHNSTIPTIVKTRFVGGGQQLLRVDYEDRTEINKDPNFMEAFNMDLEQHMKYFDGIILSDYNKGVVVPEIIQHISCLQHQYQKVVTADTHKTDWNLFKGFTCLTPNRIEFQQQCREPLTDLKVLSRYATKLREKYGLEQLMVTLSEEGILLVTEDGQKHLPVQKKDIVDVTGAGDTVIAVYTLGLTAGLNPYDAVALANKAAGVVVSKMGTATVTPEELWA
jgi:rfaE bifunctional protein kinase chain/domain